MILLWKSTSAPVDPLIIGQGGNAPVISPLSGVSGSKLVLPAYSVFSHHMDSEKLQSS